jgi:hypothetical protein
MAVFNARSHASALLLIVVLLVLPCPPVLADDTAFSDPEAQKLSVLLDKESKEAEATARINQYYDIGFKVLVLLLGIAATFGAAVVAANRGTEKSPQWLTVTNVATTGTATLLTAFASSQFNFDQRNAIFQAKAIALSNLSVKLQYDHPKREEFLATLEVVRRLHDHSNLSELNFDNRVGPNPPASNTSPGPLPSAVKP